MQKKAVFFLKKEKKFVYFAFCNPNYIIQKTDF